MSKEKPAGTPEQRPTGGLSRRAFLQLSLAAGSGLGALAYGLLGSGAALPGHTGVTPDNWVYSTCGFCGTGCGIEIGVKEGRAVAVRGTADYPVNEGLLCAKAIYQWQFIDAPDRGRQPLLRRDINQPFTEASWDQALDAMAARFQDLLNRHGPESIAVYNTGQMTMEEYYALGKLCRAGLRTPNLDGNTRLCMASAVVGHIRSFGTDGPVGAYADIEAARTILLVGSNMSECHPILFGRVVRAKEEHGTKLIVVDPRVTQAARIADLHLPIRPGTDVALLNAMAHVILRDGLSDPAYIEAHTTGYAELAELVAAYPPERAAEICGVPAADIVTAARWYGAERPALSLWVMGINQSVAGTAANNLLHNLALLTGQIGRPGAGSFSITGQPAAMSSREVGGSSSYPGYRAVANPEHRAEIARLWGVDPATLPDKSPAITEIVQAIHDGKVKALWVIATNPLLSLPDQNWVAAALQKLDLLVVQDAFSTAETADYAHIFLPAALWAEKDGLFTNSERRVNRVQRAIAPPGQARPDFAIIVDLAARLGHGRLLPWPSPRACFEEIKQVNRGRPCDYSGMTYERIEARRGIQWPCPDPEHPGTPRLYADGRFNTPDGRARLHAIESAPLPETPDGQYPLWLNTGRVQEHYHTGTRTRKVAHLNNLVPEAYCELNPQDAAALGVAYGDRVRVESPRGAIFAKVVVTGIVAPGSCFVPMHFSEGCANQLTLAAVDPFSKEPNYKQAAVRVYKA